MDVMFSEPHCGHPPFALSKIRQISSAAMGEIIEEERGVRGAGEGENRGRTRQKLTNGRMLASDRLLCYAINVVQKSDNLHHERSGYSPTWEKSASFATS
jgi:hypothetical protein